MRYMLLKQNNIRQILKLNQTHRLVLPSLGFKVDVLDLTLEDHAEYEVSLDKEIMPAIEYIRRGMEKGVGTLVICTAGQSRSATICIAYLMHQHKLSYE